MKDSVNLNEQKKLKRQKNIFKYGFALSATASVYGFLGFLQDKLTQFNDKLLNTPEAFDEFKLMFSKYGCETKADFELYLNKNSTIYTDWIMVNGEMKKISMVRYNQEGQIAYNDYHYTQELVNTMANENPLEYLDIGATDIVLTAAVPTLLFAGYMVQRHKYKKACKVAEAIKAESANNSGSTGLRYVEDEEIKK